MSGARVQLLYSALSLFCAALVSCAALLSCAALPQLEAGECGNRVLEEELEDCDGFRAETGAECREPGTVGQCHFDCTRRPDGTRPTCPSGWGCDATNICRRATGEWETLREIDVGSANQLMSGDFDGDGSADLVSLELPEGAGITRAKFHYFDASAQLSATRPFPLPMLAPVVGSLTDDALSDVLFSDPRVGLLRGRSDRTWLPDAFNSYRIPGTGLRVLGIWPGEVEQSAGFVVFASFEGQHGLYIADSNIAGMPRLLAPLSSAVESFAGEPAAGRLFQDTVAYPCDQVVLSVQGETSFWVYDACTTRAGVEGPAWREQAEQYQISLVPPVPVDSGPLLSDVNGDQRLDVLIGAGGIAYIAYGDGGGLAPAVPYVPAVANAPAPLLGVPMPLAVGDVTADGAADFLTHEGVFLSRPAASGSGFDYTEYALHARGYWSHGLAADFNGNGRLDFVAASSDHPNLDFFNGTGTAQVTQFTVPTNRPVRHLVSGDYDGDGLLDLALSQTGDRAGAPDSVLMAYGAPFGPPLSPAIVARMSGIEQLSTMRDGPLSHLLISSGQGDAPHSGALAMLVSNGDRIPLASIDLTTFAEDSSTDLSAAVRLAGGGLLAPGSGDVLALAFSLDGEGGLDPAQGLEAWLLPSLASNGTPARLSATFDPELAPISPMNLTSSPLALTAIALDLDGDAREELMLAAPLADGQRCSLTAFAVEPTELVSRGSWTLNEACVRVELGSLDADADGALDLIVRTGPNRDGSGSLSILWNDGRGGFSPERRTLLLATPLGHSAPLAHAVLASSAARPLTFAVVNPEGLWLVAATQQAREFEPPLSFVSRDDCTGVAAADFNGDGMPDLAYAASGNLNLHRALLETR